MRIVNPPKGGAAGPAYAPGGRYILGPHNYLTGAAVANVTDTVRAWQVDFASKGSFRANVDVTAFEAAAEVKVGLYTRGATGTVGTLVKDLGVVSLAADGEQLGPVTDIDAGAYLLVAFFKGAATASSITLAASSNASRFSPSAALTDHNLRNNVPWVRAEAALTYPGTIPADASVLTWTYSSTASGRSVFFKAV